MDLQLKGKVAVVTGGTKGIGRGIANSLAGEGVDLVINYRSNPEDAEKAAQEIRDTYGVEVLLVQGDAGKQEREAFCREIFPHLKNLFAGYPTTDDTFALSSEHDLLYTELTGAIMLYLEAYGV